MDKKKKDIMVDMDDVIVKDGFLYIINEYLHSNYVAEDFDGFYMQDVIPQDKKEEFFNYFLTKNMYEHGILLPDVVSSLKELSNYFNIYITTSYIFPEIPDKCGRILKDKFEFLIKTLPFISPYNYIFVSDKNMLNFDIKIDDSISNLGNSKIKILFTAYHNRKLDDDELNEQGIIRGNDWVDIKKKLLKLK